MNSYFSPRLQTMIIGGPFAIVLVTLVAIKMFVYGNSLGSSLTQSIPLAFTLVAAGLASSRATSFVIQIINKFTPIELPDLNGEWSVHQGSNWPRIKKLLDGEGLTDLTSTPLLDVEGRLSLKMNLFRITGTYKALDTSNRRTSRTRESDIVTASLTHRDGRTKLAYSAEAVVNDPAPETDETNYHFSALLKFDHDSLTSAKGHYSTDRNWKQGLNTAGQMTISKLPR